MRERQVEQHHVARLGQAVLHLVALLHHRVVVAVADHAGLRRPGRARRVDEREEVVLVDRVGALVERAGCVCGVRASALAQRGEVGEREDVADAEALDLRPLLVVLDEHADRLGVLEHVLRVARRARCVDRRADRADERSAKSKSAHSRLVRARIPNASPFCDAEREQAVRELVDRGRPPRPR